MHKIPPPKPHAALEPGCAVGILPRVQTTIANHGRVLYGRSGSKIGTGGNGIPPVCATHKQPEAAAAYEVIGVGG
eukprot:5607823-Amphidinium_carterae.1